MNSICKVRFLVQCPGCIKRKMSSTSMYNLKHLHPYAAPTWAQHLKGIPTHRLKLANLSTPINKWDLPGTPEGFEVYIKRDDMTGSTLSGNKVRKLEFLLADAIKNGYKHVITCGGVQSNHCRATAVACRQLGLKPHLFLRAKYQNSEEVPCDGNVMLDRLVGADIYMTPWKAPQKTELLPRMEKLAEKILAETGEKAYILPAGGSNALGFWGYLNAFQELLDQGVAENFDDIVFACGGGGTVEGLSVGNLLSGSKLRLHGVGIAYDRKSTLDHTRTTLDTYGLHAVNSEDMFEFVEGYIGAGYATTDPESLEFSVEVASKTGIVLDPTYTLKATRGLVSEMQNNPGRFKGKRILYIHTGGLLGMYDGRLHETLNRPGSVANAVNMWHELNNPPF